MKRIMIINGPNLNLLGKREPEIYGNEGMDSYIQSLRLEFESIEILYYQTNIEGEIINKLHEVGFSYEGILLNAGAYTHTSVAIGDAVKAIQTPVIEIHISNTLQREDFRHISYISPVAKGVIMGFGLQSYKLGIASFMG